MLVLGRKHGRLCPIPSSNAWSGCQGCEGGEEEEDTTCEPDGVEHVQRATDHEACLMGGWQDVEGDRGDAERKKGDAAHPERES